MLPDLGMTLAERGWEASLRLTLVGLSPRCMADCGGHREVTCVTYLDSFPLGVMLTVATLQSQDEIVRKLTSPNLAATGYLGPRSVGGGGEIYRPFLGRVTKFTKEMMLGQVIDLSDDEPVSLPEQADQLRALIAREGLPLATVETGTSRA